VDLRLAGKRALVTGGSQGLGRAVARELAAEGCRVAVAARTADRLALAADAITAETGTQVVSVPIDMLDPESIKAGAAEAVGLLGGLDILVNAAARTGGRGEEADVFATASEEGMITDYTEKVVGSLRLTRAAAPALCDGGWGRVILFSGGAGRVRGGLVSAGARNRAINNLALTIANDLGRYGVGCVAVAPSFAVTERQMDAHRHAAEQADVPLEDYLHDRAVRTTLLQRLVLGDDLAKAVCFLCSPLSWTINATTVELAGGSSPDIHYELEPHPPWQPGMAR
jgi:NAD(P)-dependent dehydrogenase (short-subunit alcohol dehydrogenase family)